MIEYNQGNIQLKIDGHRSVLTCAKTVKHTVDGNPVDAQVKESKLTGQPAIVKAVTNAVFPLSVRTKGLARFNEKTGCVKWNKQQITPESDLTALPEDIQAFCQAIRTPSTIKTFNALKEPEYETDDIPHSKIQLIDGAPVLVNTIEKRVRTESVRVRNPDKTLAFTRDAKGVKQPLFADVPILKS